MSFELDALSAPGWAARQGLLADGAEVFAEEFTGGVSATVVALRPAAGGAGLVLKQALPRLRVREEWLATQERNATEAAAMTLCAGLTPGAVPRVLAVDPVNHIVAMELIEGCVNWQTEIGDGRVHAAAGRWAGRTLGLWHAKTVGDALLEGQLGDGEAFEQLRLRPFHETVAARLPDLAELVLSRAEELRCRRRCLVHGDYAMKNMLIGSSGHWVLDFEVAHRGNPLFDLGFFLSFAVLSAIRWEPLVADLEALASGFLGGYAQTAGTGFAGTEADVVAHTACLVLARTDGKSPALFLDGRSRERAREIGAALLREPDRGLWAWV
ncbi:MAG: phosphotransferase family protein [Gaiella sp.]